MEFNKIDALINSLKKSMGSNFNQEHAENYARYCLGLKLNVKKNGELANPWMQDIPVERLDFLFRKVAEEGLVFDGNKVTLNRRGLSYDYRAYKAKMLIAYPESKIDLQLVYEGDDFSFKKENGKVIYHHYLKTPFSRKEIDIIGGYLVVRNQRGEFLTTLSREDFEKHKKIAETHYIWDGWYPEMCLKTVARKGFKFHFDDVFEKMNEMDNVNYDLEKIQSPPPKEEKRPNEKQWRSFQDRFKRGVPGTLEMMKQHYDLTDLEEKWIVDNRPTPNPDQWSAIQQAFDQGDTDMEAIERSYKLNDEQDKWIKSKS